MSKKTYPTKDAWPFNIDDTFPPEKCCICDKPFEKPDFGCNPFPIADKGRCCNWCDSVLVNPARFTMMHHGHEVGSLGKQLVAQTQTFIWAHKESQELKKKMMESMNNE